MATQGYVLSVQSHVCHGYVGNRAATFPLQLLGFEVDVINSVQFSTHTGYGSIRGQKLTGEELRVLAEGLELNGVFSDVSGRGEGGYSYLLTGYIGTATACRAVVDLLEKMRAGDDKCVYVCDPVLGDNGQLYVPAELVDIYRREVVPKAHILAPNQFEAESLLGRELGSISSLEAACAAAEELHGLGPSVVCITTLDACASDSSVVMFLSEKGKELRWLLRLPRLDGGPFTGTGDLTSAMLLAWGAAHPSELPLALEKVGAVMQGVLRTTMMTETGSPPRCFDTKVVPPELRLVASKKQIEAPQVLHRCRAVWPQGSLPIRGVIFDMDGTLTLPGQINFARMRQRAQVPDGEDVVNYLMRTHQGNDEALRASLAVVEDEERLACQELALRADVRETLGEVARRGLKCALLTRNSDTSTKVFMEVLGFVSDGFAFDPVLTRDSLENAGIPNKPAPNAVHHVAQAWSCSPAELLVVGDSADDILCAQAAGAKSCVVLSEDTSTKALSIADASVSDLYRIVDRLL